MRPWVLGTAALACVPVSPASASDKINSGPVPTWVHSQAIPAAKPGEAPVALLLHDEQVSLQPGKISSFRETAFKIQTAEGLSAGNLSIVWEPELETVTVHKLHILRGDKVIDVLGAGQTFTILRRETNLDAATLDGSLTATIQPEGLQEGDVVDLAVTVDRADPVMKGHVESTFAAWGGVPITLAHASVQWPGSVKLNIRESAELPPVQRSSIKGVNVIEMSGHDVQPLIAPKGAPLRFRIGRLAEASDYASWADVADLMLPLYKAAAVVPPSGPLHDEVEKIRAASSDPLVRATQALALVQNRVRYVALLMGQGGYVPASAEQTWSRRFGDCKAKTSLLLAVLQSLGIQGEPVMVGVKVGDAIADRLPSVGMFNHVLVRAHIRGRDYWLDGTRTGDTDLNGIQTPDFGWGLPLVQHASLFHLVPSPLAQPDLEHVIAVDASAGVFADAPITLSEIYRGDTAVALNNALSAATEEQRNEYLRSRAVRYFDGFHANNSSVQFDRPKQTLTLSMKGTAKLNWKDGWYSVPTSSLAFDPDFDRPAGPQHDAPLEVNFPSFVKDRVTLILPPGLAATQKLDAPVHETLAGVEYARTETVNGNALVVDSSERSVVPEVAYKAALADEARLRSLSKDDIYLNVSGSYAPTQKDLAALKDAKPNSAEEYFVRAGAEAQFNDNEAALADLNAGLALDQGNAWALRKRSLIRIQKGDLDGAEKDIDAADNIDPGNVVGMNGRIVLAEARRQPQSALDWSEKVLAKDPKNEFALAHRLGNLATLGRNDEAIAASTAALATHPTDGMALISRAMAEQNSGAWEAAARDARAAAQIDPKNPGYSMVLGSALASGGKFSEAVAAFSNAIETAKARDPNKPFWQALAARANAYRALGRFDEALADSEQLLGWKDSIADTRMLRANIFSAQHNRQAEAAEAAALVRDWPNDDYALVVAGNIYGALGQTSDAMKAFSKALAVKPAAYIYLNRQAVRPQSDMAGRMSDLDAALKLEPDDPASLTAKARLLTRTGDLTGALALLQRAKSNPADEYSAIQLATVMYKAGRVAEANALFAKIRSGTKSPIVLNNLCWAKATSDILLASAVDDCRAALKLTPQATNAEDSLGMALLKAGKLDEALDAYNKALANGPSASSLMGRAFVYLRKGDRAHANADAAAARALSSQIDDVFAGYNLKFDAPPPPMAAAETRR